MNKMKKIHKVAYLTAVAFISITIFILLVSSDHLMGVDGSVITNTIIDETSANDITSDNDLETSWTSPHNTTTFFDPTTSPTEPLKNTTGKATAKTQAKTTAKTQTKTPAKTNTKKYALYVNKKQNVVTVYEKDSKGEYTVPVKVMICSTGRNNRTPTGTYKLVEKYTWRPLVGNVYGQYAFRFYNNYLFHSVPYLKQNKGTLKVDEYNKLGNQASDGCVRLRVIDSKWIFDNCAVGTKVVVYQSDDPGPLGKPGFTPISDTYKWDPTDPDVNNPWNKVSSTETINSPTLSATPTQASSPAVIYTPTNKPTIEPTDESTNETTSE